MDFKNFENEVFNELPELVIGSNFKNCTFNVEGKFERCNLEDCIFNKVQHFYLSNVTTCEGADECEFDKSNNIKEKLEDIIIEE